MNGKTVVITGATSGIGRSTAKLLAKRGATMILACRNLSKCGKMKEELRVVYHNDDVSCYPLDLTSFDSVRECADAISKDHDKIDVLINNAGVMFHPENITKNGFELHLQVNFLSPFLLTGLLLRKLGDGGRIINITSSTYEGGDLDFKDIQGHGEWQYQPELYTSRSKLALMCWSEMLAERLKDNVSVTMVNPGTTGNTMISSHLKAPNVLMAPFRWLVLRSPFYASQSVVMAAVKPDLETGKLLYNCKLANIVDRNINAEQANRLWNIAVDITGLSRGFVSEAFS